MRYVREDCIESNPSAGHTDPHSYSQPDKIRVTHIDLDLHARFDQRTLQASATLTLDRQNPHEADLVLDTRDLNIHKVEVGQPNNFRNAPYEIGASDEILGAPLTIKLTAGASHVRIAYSTSPDASGLQWLDPIHTANKQAPFLFTQSQEIHARSWIPLQDTPGVRVTYSAPVTTPRGLLAVMSAGNNANGPRDGSHRFQMDRPIPPYLIALAIGDLDFAPTGERTGIYAERPLIERATYEFGEAENMLRIAEELFGPYLWNRFDLLVLPPSFPFGGMENPSVAFVTPTLLAGDRSAVSVIAHELAHAWSGNLVTNATWNDYWLNEGFTTYAEYRILEAIYGERRAEMDQVIAQQRLVEEMERLEPRDQVLHIDLAGRDPECGSSLVPYVKGALFLKSVERAFGRARFDAFLRSYFAHFAFRSITTAEAIDYLVENIFKKYPEVPAPSIREWICEPGLPSSAPTASSESLMRVRQQAQDWATNRVALDRQVTSNWRTHEWLYFLGSLPPDLGVERMRQLDEIFDLTKATNTEILFRWLFLAVRNQYKNAYARLEEFLATVGRKIYLKPLYEELVKTTPGREFAEGVYAKLRGSYHPINQTAIDKILKHHFRSV
jgi:leukotriene-A4 hydrolase